MPLLWRPLGLVLGSLCQLLLLLSPARGHTPDDAPPDNRTELRILYITSFGGEYNSSGSIPAVEIAMEQINNSSDILEDYRLVYEVGDSQCDATVARREFFNRILRGEPKIALVGAGCSVATESVAEVSQFWNITHMSYASSTSSLNSRALFPNFWRTYPSEDNLAKAVMVLVQQYGWQQLKIITQDESLFTASSELLMSGLMEAGVFVDQNGTTLFHSDAAMADAEDLFSPEIRVYFLNMYSLHARRILCAAAKAAPTDERYYPSYVWITLGWYPEQWWTQDVASDTTVNCTDADFEPLLKRTLAIQQFPTAEDPTGPTNVSLTAEEFSREYEQRLNDSGFGFEVTGAHAYDAIWALAFALDRALPLLSESNLTLESFDYSTTAASISSAVQQQLSSLTSESAFTGVTGPLNFNENGTRTASQPRVLQYRDGSRTNLCGESGPTPLERVRIGTVNAEGVFNYTACDDNDTTWPAGIPSDGTPDELVGSLHPALFIAYSVLTSLGILFAIFCLFFNIIFKKRKIVRLTSPNLNFAIIAGAIMLYASVYFFVIPSTNELTVTIFCQARSWLQTMGYFLCFGIILAKMWRVYYIFHNPSPKKKRNPPKDWHLLLGAVVMTLVSAIVLICVAIFDDYTAKRVADKEKDSTRNADRLLVNYFILNCDGENSIIWIIFLYGYIVVTQIVAVILAFRTRKVKIKALNDAKYITMTIYFTTVILTVMVIGAITLQDYINADAGVFGGGIMVFTTAVLVLIFIPKMVVLYKDPRGEKIFDRSYSQSHPTFSETMTDAERERLVELEKHCKNLERRLSKYEHVEPLKSFNRVRKLSSSLDMTTNLTYSLSTSKQGLTAQNPMTSLGGISLGGNSLGGTPLVGPSVVETSLGAPSAVIVNTDSDANSDEFRESPKREETPPAVPEETNA